MRAWKSLLLVATVASPSASRADTAPPEPLRGPVAELVAAERAFARRSVDVGTKTSFLEFFAQDAVTFAPDPGPARPRLEQLPPPETPPRMKLEWAPEQAEVSASGDLGWTSGPFVREDRTGKAPALHGTYFSLWRKQTGGGWKVVLDVGVTGPPAPLPERATEVRATSASKRPATAPDSADDVLHRDQELCRELAVDAGKAYAAALAANARVHREGQAPLVGEAKWRPWAGALTGALSCRPATSFASAGLGYAYGSWERRAAAGAPEVERGFYVRVWRRESSWRVAVDVAVPVAPR